ncbi:MAG: hypothetical protein KDB14_21705 [Planctomycetales bacterium]|nr:hypothetical protein [Planctomycetales bacterium]
MGTTFLAVGEPPRGFWLRDGILELWLRFLALHVEDPVEDESLATQIHNQWLLASRGFFNGCVPDGISEAVSSTEGERIVRDAIHSLLKVLRESPAQLSKDVLNAMGFCGGAFTADIQTWRLVEVSEAVIDLLDGKIGSTASDTSFMPGCGPAR